MATENYKRNMTKEETYEYFYGIYEEACADNILDQMLGTKPFEGTYEEWFDQFLTMEHTTKEELEQKGFKF